MKKGILYFFTGLAGAGKTTLGGMFYEQLRKTSPDAILLDGDQIREKIGDSCPMTGTVLNEERYTTAARKSGAWSLFAQSRDFREQRRDVVSSSISMYSEIREWNRANIENYREIYIKVTRETLYRRDQKQLYSSGTKNVVGVDLPWDEPESPDVVVRNDGRETPEAIVNRLTEIFGLPAGGRSEAS